MGVKGHLAALKMVGESLEQFLHLLVRQVHQEPLGNDYRRLVAAYLIQKAGVGNLRSDQGIPLAWWVEAPAELDHLGIVQVIPADACWRVNALHAAIQTAPHMQHSRVRMLGEKGCCPAVQLLRPDHHAECRTLGELYLTEIVIDAAERLFGSLVVQKRVLRATIERFEIQRHQKGFLHLGEMNLFGLHQIPPCERSARRGSVGEKLQMSHRSRSGEAQCRQTIRTLPSLSISPQLRGPSK